MKSLILLIVTSLFLYSCEASVQTESVKEKKQMDSIAEAIEIEVIKELARQDSIKATAGIKQSF
jgi:hypothetical protein